MSKSSQNKLKFIFAGVILLLVVFTVVAFAVPFEGKFNAKYWISFAFAFASVIASIFGLGIVMNSEDYNNEAAASKISIIGCLSALVGVAGSIVFMAVNIAEAWIPAVVLAVIFVIIVMAILYVVFTAKTDETAEEKTE
jgi:heme/copper-type cytochrome/quinol oxidase subunit 4